MNLNIYIHTLRRRYSQTVYRKRLCFQKRRNAVIREERHGFKKFINFPLFFFNTWKPGAALRTQFYQTTFSDVVRVPLQFSKQIIVIAQGME